MFYLLTGLLPQCPAMLGLDHGFRFLERIKESGTWITHMQGCLKEADSLGSTLLSFSSFFFFFFFLDRLVVNSCYSACHYEFIYNGILVIQILLQYPNHSSSLDTGYFDSLVILKLSFHHNCITMTISENILTLSVKMTGLMQFLSPARN